MNELRILGNVDVRGTDGERIESIVTRSKSLALLSYLCLAARGRPQRRELLISVFWPEYSEPRARNALNQSLHRLRRALGPDTVRSHGTSEVEIDPTTLSCDAIAFLDALDTGELEIGLDLYRGDLLAGLFVAGAPDFERWLEGERASLRRKAFDGALALGRVAEDSGDLDSAVGWYRRATTIMPERGSAVRHLMAVLARTGDPAQAVRQFERFASRLAEDYDLQPSEKTLAVVQSIRSSTTVHENRPHNENAQTRRATPKNGLSTPESADTGDAADVSAPVSRRSRSIGVPVLLGIAVVAASALVALGNWPGRGPILVTTSRLIHVTSDPGLEFQPAISPDGRDVAYVEGPVGKPRVVVRSAVEVGTGESRPAAGTDGKHWYPNWTPDGAFLRIWFCENRWRPDPGCEWRRVGSLAGPAQTISVPRLGRYAWSADGSRVAFVVEDSIYAYSASDPEPVLLGTHSASPQEPHSLVWSPDGRWIAYVNGNPRWGTSANVDHASIWILSANGGTPIPVTDESRLNVSPQWLPDSKHLLFVTDRDGSRGVYVVGVGPDGPDGPPRGVAGISDPHSISVSADGAKLAFASFPVRQNIRTIPLSRSGPISLRDQIGTATLVTTGNQVIEAFNISPDGEWIAFDNNVRGEFDIYKQRLAGGEPQLVADIGGNAFEPVWSPDGAELAFHGGDGDIWVVPAGGGAALRVVDLPDRDIWPVWSPDGLAIAFSSVPFGSEGTPPRGLWTVSRDSLGTNWNEPIQVTDLDCYYHDWAPEGRSIFCMGRDDWVLVSPEGEILSRVTKPPEISEGIHPRFSPDGSRINFNARLADGSRGVWWMPADGGTATEVATFDDPSLTVWTAFVWADNLYFTCSEYESDIWVADLNW